MSESRARNSSDRHISARNSGSSNQDRRTNFVVQGSLLAIAGIMVRLIGMLYRVPLTAIIGAEGNGYYTSAFSIYSLLLILSSYSMPTAISKVVSGNLAQHKYKNTQRVLKAAFVYATAVGMLMFMVLYFGADAIASMLKKPYCEYALRALAPTVWIMAYLGILRGYFQGTGNMVPTAISQILEQVMNAIVSVLAASLLFQRGEVANKLYSGTEYTYAFGAAGGCIGTGAGAALALAFFLMLFMSQRRYRNRMIRREDSGIVDSYGSISRVLLLTMLPILFSSTVYNVSSVIDDYLFGNIQTYLGHAENIVKQWGLFGEYHIIFNIPVALANALSSSLIPSLTRAVEAHDRKNTLNGVRYSIRFTMLIAIPATIGIFVLAEPICELLFPGASMAMLVNIVRVGALAIALYSLSTISNAILQGLGFLNIPLKNAIISLVIHIASLVGLMFMGLGIYAVVIANIIFALTMCILNQLAIRKYVRFDQEITKVYILPLFASIMMGASAFAVYKGLSLVLPKAVNSGRVGALVTVVPAVLIAIVVYFATLILTHAFTREDLDNMPMGGRLKRFVR